MHSRWPTSLHPNLSNLLPLSTLQTPTKGPTFRKCIALLQTQKSYPKIIQIHAWSIRHGIPITDPCMGKHLIFSLVSISAPMPYTHTIFTHIHGPTIFTYNTMIKGYAESDTPHHAMHLYHHMHALSILPDTHTYPFLLKAIAKLMDTRVGEMVHSQTIKHGLDGLVFVQNSMVHMYATCGLVENAYKVFEMVPEKGLVTWNSLINGYAINGRPNEALTLYREMGHHGVAPDGFTMVSLMCAGAELGALALGRRAHVYVLKVGLIGNLHVGNALIDLYAKCGAIREAHWVFGEMGSRSVVSWTSLIVGWALNGYGEDALKLFGCMEREELVPTEITFVGVLYACSHCGLVSEGFEYFNRMRDVYGLVPKIEHYGCMVDLLGRAGMVNEAHEFISKMPLEPNAVVWRTLLGACAMHGHVALGEIARSRLAELDPGHCGDYVLLSNLYASDGRWLDAQGVRKTMFRKGVRKAPGHSLVEVGNCVHEFVMGDRSHPQKDEIYAMLEEITKLLKLQGYMPRTSNVLVDIEEEEKEKALCYHSEKLAIAFALISTPSGTAITVIKNLRVCVDCHVATKIISKVFDREIIVRDRSRFHHFRDGSCSCKDYW
ncbi:pentatricopeptide repeat-containing protein At4g21065-like [Magnolia sinica]|uniref:pentatricopeptide repeat-containing protein At4g21065-like n=1 Tax=Magnolia sinica TaxID=86752 RepID=UPI0026591063|nr:pentatricopeptide repeat-containing protein At4g21065-like [Magnolia sinica]